MGTFTPIPLGLDDFVQGGLLSDVPVEILQIKFRGFDYGGAVSKDILAVWVQFGLLDDNLKRTTDEPVEQFMSAGGDLDEVMISEPDGDMVGVLNSTGAKSAMTKGSNFEIFLQSLTKPINGGPAMPKNWLRDNHSSLKCLLGLKFHLFRSPAPKREGIDTSGRKRKEFEQQVPTATKVYWAPWAAKQAAGKVDKKPAAAATAQAAAAPAETTQQVNGSAAAAGGGVDEITQQAIDTVKAVLADNPIFESIDDLKVAAFRHHSKTKADTRNQIVKTLADPAWLVANGFKVQPADAAGKQMVIA